MRLFQFLLLSCCFFTGFAGSSLACEGTPIERVGVSASNSCWGTNFKDGSFDVVLSVETIETLTEAMLRQGYRGDDPVVVFLETANELLNKDGTTDRAIVLNYPANNGVCDYQMLGSRRVQINPKEFCSQIKNILGWRIALLMDLSRSEASATIGKKMAFFRQAYLTINGRSHLEADELFQLAIDLSESNTLPRAEEYQKYVALYQDILRGGFTSVLTSAEIGGEGRNKYEVIWSGAFLSAGLIDQQLVGIYSADGIEKWSESQKAKLWNLYTAGLVASMVSDPIAAENALTETLKPKKFFRVANGNGFVAIEISDPALNAAALNGLSVEGFSPFEIDRILANPHPEQFLNR